MAVLYLRGDDGQFHPIETISGKTPVKGVDYFTPEEIQKITQDAKIPVDAQLSETSENPVQNKAIYKALDGKADMEGEWEQIVDAVTEKEVDEVVFDTEHDGNPYRFKKIKFFFEIQLNNQQLNGFFNNNRYTYTTGRKVTGLYYGLAVLDKTSDNFEYTITDAKTGKGLQTSYNPVLQAGGAITKVRTVLIGNGGIEPVPVGSKFVIWAVR